MDVKKATEAWKKNPNKMIIFKPNTQPWAAKYPDTWLLVDGGGVIGTGPSEQDMKTMRDWYKRKRGF